MDPLRTFSPALAPVKRPAAAPPQRPDSFEPGQEQAVDLRRAAAAMFAGATGAPDPLWTVSGRFSTPPAAGPAGLAVGEGKRLVVLSPESGGERWSAELPHEAEWCGQGPDGAVYVGGRFGFVQAFGPDGTPRWSRSAGVHLSDPPSFAADGTFLGLQGGALVGRDPATGEELWRASGALGLNDSGPVPGPGGGVLVHADNGLFLFGAARWRVEEATTQGCVTRGAVWAGSPEGLLEVDPATGGVRRTVKLPGSVVAAPAAGPDGTVYVPLRGSRVAAVRDGEVLWTSTAYTDKPSFLAVVDGLVLVGTRGLRHLAALDPATGHRRWVHEAEAASLGPAAVAGERAFVASHAGVVALDGQVRLEQPDAPAGTIEIGEGRVRIGGVDLPLRAEGANETGGAEGAIKTGRP